MGLVYVAVRTSDTQTRSLLTYGRLVVREAQRHNGPGWLEYDRIFRQHAALSPLTVWHELNPSLHASTVLSYRAGPGKVCSLCHEPDHAVDVCAMQVLQPQPTPTAVQQSLPPHSELGAVRVSLSWQEAFHAGQYVKRTQAGASRDAGTHLILMEQGAMLISIMQIQAHMCNLQAAWSQGKGVPADPI